MIQDIGNKKFDNQYDPTAVCTADDYVFAFEDGRILIRLGDEDIDVPKMKELGDIEASDLRYLFSIDDDRYFLLKEGAEIALPDGYAYESMRALRMCTPKCMAGMTANHIYVWYRDNKFCGRCGKATVHDDKLRMVKCPDCGNMIFPRINPAVIIGLRNGDSLMTSKYANRPQSNGRALLAGFCEIGETAEETVIREVMEEVGLKATNVQYYGSQPWGFAGNISLGYFCDLDGDDKITLDEEELACAEFMKREDLPEPNNMVSLTATMIEEFRKGNW